MIKRATIEKWTWPVVYGGLFLAILGASLWRNDEPGGVPLIGVGVVVTAVGAALVWWRSRLGDDAPPGPPAAPSATDTGRRPR